MVAILARRTPLKEDWSPSLRDRWLRRALLLPLVVALPVLVGGGVIGLVLVVLGTRVPDDGTGEVLISLARFPFFGAAGWTLAQLAMWREQKRRTSTGDVASAGVTAIGCVLSTLLLWTSPRAGIFLPLLTSALSALSLGAFVAMLVFSKGKLSGRPWSRKPSHDVQDRINRKKVLHLLVQRGVADLDTQQQAAMHELPVGAWSRLDDVRE